MEHFDAKKLVTELFYSSLRAVDAYESVKLYMDKISSIYRNGNYTRFFCIGFGKASCQMVKSVQDFMKEFIDAGVVITKYGHCLLSLTHEKIKIFEAGHPIPDENGLQGTKEIIRILKDSDERTLVVCLISGGGSALLVYPCDGITLNEKKHITQLLLRAGANINELNTVRKHISRVKGGRLAELAYPSRLLSLIISDVIGDRLDVIASGPTSPDKTTYGDALYVIEKYRLLEKIPETILTVLQQGEKGIVTETPKEGNNIFNTVENIIIGSNKKGLEAAKACAEYFGLKTDIVSSEISGEARDAGRWLAKKAKEVKSSKATNCQICLISGGETTVTVKGPGIGGRNMEFALSFATEIEGIDGITLLSAGTDGTDGPTNAAGAIVNGQTVHNAKAIDVDPEKFLLNNDSYNFFKQIDKLFITGPTGTNVMDVQIAVIE